MNPTLMKYDARRLASMWGVGMIALAIYVVFVPGPLTPGISELAAAALFGLAVGTRLMADTGSTQSFVFSRGVPRRNVVAGRVLLGIMSLVLASLLVWGLLSSPIRSSIHHAMGYQDAVYYPMVARFESAIALTFAKTSTAAMLFMTFLMIFQGMRDPKLTTTASGNLQLWLLKIPLLLSFVLFLAFIPFQGDPQSWLPSLFAWGSIALTALLAIVALMTCNQLEVDS